jgi:hypothetical protein
MIVVPRVDNDSAAEKRRSVIVMLAARPVLGAQRAAEIQAQLETMVDRYKPGSIVKLVVSPSVVEGRGFMPVTGFAMETLPTAPFIPSHYDLHGFFKGRCIIPFHRTATELPLQTIGPPTATSMLSAAKKGLLKKFNRGNPAMRLRRSPDHVIRYGVLLDPLHGQRFLVVETQMLPALDETEGVDLSTFLLRSLERRNDEASIGDVFFNNSDPLGSFMRRYYRAQKTYREVLAKRLLKQLRKTLLGRAVGVGRDLHREEEEEEEENGGDNEEEVEEASGSSMRHMITNVPNYTPGNNTVVFFSEMVDASLESGALIDAGPFRSALWVTHEMMSSPSARELNPLHALPFDTPRGDPYSTFERILPLNVNEFSPGITITPISERFATKTTSRKDITLYNPIARPNLNLLKVTVPSLSPLARIKDGKTNVISSFVVGRASQKSLISSAPIVSCFQDLEYTMPFDRDALIESLRALGVDMSVYGSNHEIFFLDPELTVQSGQEMRFADVLVTMAQRSACIQDGA